MFVTNRNDFFVLACEGHQIDNVKVQNMNIMHTNAISGLIRM